MVSPSFSQPTLEAFIVISIPSHDLILVDRSRLLTSPVQPTLSLDVQHVVQALAEPDFDVAHALKTIKPLRHSRDDRHNVAYRISERSLDLVPFLLTDSSTPFTSQRT